MKFENGTKDVILEDCVRIHNAIGLNFIVTDGKDVDFQIEKEPFAEGPNANYFNSTLL
jgi:hypothetical protein